MRTILLILLTTILSISCTAQKGVNQKLKSELDEIMRLDQSYRMLFDNNISTVKKDSLLKALNVSKEDFQKKSWALVNKQDSINLIKVENIISKYGYPGKSLVGEPTNKSAWYVIQHSDNIPQYLPLIKKAAEKNELSFTLYAMMLDRFLMDKGEEQIYGSQGYGTHYVNSEGKEINIDLIWPIKNAENVNELREKSGFKQTIEEYAKDLYGEDFIFKHYSIEEAKKISGN